MPNSWTEFIKKKAKELNIPYGCALSMPEVSKEYKEIKQTKTTLQENRKNAAFLNGRIKNLNNKINQLSYRAHGQKEKPIDKVEEKRLKDELNKTKESLKEIYNNISKLENTNKSNVNIPTPNIKEELKKPIEKDDIKVEKVNNVPRAVNLMKKTGLSPDEAQKKLLKLFELYDEEKAKKNSDKEKLKRLKEEISQLEKIANIIEEDDEEIFDFRDIEKKIKNLSKEQLIKLAKDKLYITISNKDKIDLIQKIVLLNIEKTNPSLKTLTKLGEYIDKFFFLNEGSGLIPRIGGKNLLKKTIVDYFPPNYKELIYIEPFVGGGHIFYEKEPSIKEIINDLDPNVYRIYKGFKKYPVEKINPNIIGTYNKEDYLNLKQNLDKQSDFQKFINTLILFKISYMGKIDTFKGSKDKSFDIKKPYKKEDHTRLKGVTILNKDYKDLINKYDSLKSFFYFDPPYEGSKKLYKKGVIDYEEMKDILKKLKGKFLLSINDSPYIRNIFKDFNIKTVQTMYSIKRVDNKNPIINELIISNYNI